MIIGILLALVLQGNVWVVSPASPTVGDSVRLERVVPADPAVLGRARALERNDLVEPLGAPEVLPAAGGLVVRYTLALFAPGRHALPMPPLELVHPDGRVELVLGDTAVIDVAAVVPDTAAPPKPRPSRAPFARARRQPAAVVAALTVVGLVLAGWLALRYRRRSVPPPPPPDEPSAAGPPVRWLAAGERRAVATVASARLRGRIEELLPAAGRAGGLADCLAVIERERPAWPRRELADVLSGLERARFAPLAGDDLAELVDRADVLVAQLAPPTTAETP